MGGVQVSYRDVFGQDETPKTEQGHARILFHAVGESSTKVLSARGVLELAKMGEFIYISRDAIGDRSKADTFQKFLVLLQVSWMVCQCIARRAYGLPITLLEVHAMVHVACAILMYAFWIEVGTTP
jgi:hypothetical protein